MFETREVPNDGNCIFWSTMFAYLEPVKKDKTKFQKRYQNLFKKLEAWENIFNYFNNENGNIKNFKDIMLLFRENSINYMQENIKQEHKECLISLLPDFNVKNKNILDVYEIKEIENFEQYCDVMKKDGVFADQIELIYISEFLKHNLVIFTDENSDQKQNINEKFNEEIKLNYVEGKHFNYFIETLEYDSGYDSKLDNDNDNPEKILAEPNLTNNINSPKENSSPNNMLTNKEEIREKKELENLQEEIERSKKALQQLNAQARLLEQENIKLLQKNQSNRNDKKFQKLYNKLEIIILQNMKKVKELENIIINHDEMIEKLEQENKNKDLVIKVKEKSARWWKSKYDEEVQKKDILTINLINSQQKSEINETKDENNLQIKIDKLEEEIAKLHFKISDDIIDNLTEATAKKNMLLEERNNLENQKISKFKNFMIKFLTFGYYDKNEKIKNKFNKNKNELDKTIDNEEKFLKEYKTARSNLSKLYKELDILKNDSAIGFEKDKLKINIQSVTNNNQSYSSKTQKM